MDNTVHWNRLKNGIIFRVHFVCIIIGFFIFLATACCFFPCFAAQRTSAVIHIDHRLAREVVPVVKGLLSPEGTAAADTRTNSLVVVDTPRAIQRIRDFLEGFDYPLEQVKVSVRFKDNRNRNAASVDGEGRISGDDWDVSTGDRDREDDGLSVRLEGQRVKRQSESEYYLTVSSGSAAYIAAGTSVPFEQQWIDLCRKHGHIIETVEFRNVDAGFEVSPIIVGDRAHIEITPRISYLNPEDGENVIRFTEASTHLTVPLNQWTSLGGAVDDDNEVARKILGYQSGSSGTDVGISLMVEKTTFK
jgi:hypothetical protein